MVIDDFGARHLAAQCSWNPSEIRYAVSTDGRTWTTTVFAPPIDRLELSPRLAVSGKTLYLAYTVDKAIDGGCGDDGLEDRGVYVRTRDLPNGVWSAPRLIGVTRDHLESLRVAGSAIHATVLNEADGRAYYERLNGDVTQRYLIPGDVRGTSLRVGDDGRGRVAYGTPQGISYGSVANGVFTSSLIPNTSRGQGPDLVLAPGNIAWIGFVRAPDSTGGCAGGEDASVDGTWIATNLSGRWVSQRLTTILGGTSLSVDTRTGEINVIVSVGGRVIRYHRLPAEATWRHETIVRGSFSAFGIKQDPISGAWIVALQEESPDALSSEVAVMSSN